MNGINDWIDALGGVKEAVEGIVGRLQVKEHLAHLIIIQLVWGRHAAEGGQPGEEIIHIKKRWQNC